MINTSTCIDITCMCHCFFPCLEYSQIPVSPKWHPPREFLILQNSRVLCEHFKCNAMKNLLCIWKTWPVACDLYFSTPRPVFNHFSCSSHDVTSFLICIIQKCQYLKNKKWYSKRENAILLDLKKPFKYPAIISRVIW